MVPTPSLRWVGWHTAVALPGRCGEAARRAMCDFHAKRIAFKKEVGNFCRVPETGLKSDRTSHFDFAP
jgi:hypothetical protein